MFPILHSILIFVSIFDIVRNEIIETSYGSLVGEQLETIQGRKYHVFRKIPFAKPPLRELRFQPPQPPESWNGIRNATQRTPACIQNGDFSGKTFNVAGDEDCLYLDVYKPSMVIEKALPVIVHIFGGRFAVGSLYFIIPEYFMDYEVIVVNIQYRLNVFGFASFGDDVLSGNLGMKDQVAALRYVQANIASFGGNPHSVTLMGHSSGAASTHFHLFSRLSTGLFHRIIAMAGSAYMPTFFKNARSVKKATLNIAERVGCHTSSSQQLIQCLQTVPADHLINEHEKLLFENTIAPLAILALVPEPNTSDAFLTEYPHRVVNNVPILSGCNYREGSFILGGMLNVDKHFRFWKDDLKRFFPIVLNYGEWMNEEESSRVSDTIFDIYFKQNQVDVKQSEELIDLFSDSFFTLNVLEMANTHPNTVYLYLFDHNNKFWFPAIVNMPRNATRKRTIPHANELYMLFHLPDFPQPKLAPGTDDFNVSQRMLQYFVNFATKGNPNADDQQLWKLAMPEQLQYLNISTFQDQMQEGFQKERYKLWRKLNAIRPESTIQQTAYKDEL